MTIYENIVSRLWNFLTSSWLHESPFQAFSFPQTSSLRSTLSSCEDRETEAGERMGELICSFDFCSELSVAFTPEPVSSNVAVMFPEILWSMVHGIKVEETIPRTLPSTPQLSFESEIRSQENELCSVDVVGSNRIKKWLYDIIVISCVLYSDRIHFADQMKFEGSSDSKEARPVRILNICFCV